MAKYKYTSPYQMEQALANQSKKRGKKRNKYVETTTYQDGSKSYSTNVGKNSNDTSSYSGRGASNNVPTGGPKPTTKSGRSPSYYSAPSIFDITTAYGRKQQEAYKDLVANLGDDRTASYTLGKFIDERFQNLNNELYADQSAQRDAINKQIDINKLAAKQGNWDYVDQHPIDFSAMGISAKEAGKRSADILDRMNSQIEGGANKQIVSIINNKYLEYYGGIRSKTQYQENTLGNAKRDYETYLEQMRGGNAAAVGTNAYQKMLDAQGIKSGTNSSSKSVKNADGSRTVTYDNVAKAGKSKSGLTAAQVQSVGDSLKDKARNAALKIQQEKNFKGSWSEDDLKSAYKDVLDYQNFTEGKGTWDKKGKYSSGVEDKKEDGGGHNLLQKVAGGLADLLPKGAENYVTDKFIESHFGDVVTGGVTEPLKGAMELLAYPNNVKNRAMNAFLDNVNKDVDHSHVKGRDLGPALRWLDTIQADPFKKALSAGWEGIKDGPNQDYQGVSKSVQKFTAVGNVDESQFKSKIGIDLLNDLATDPLNFIGVGAVTTPMRVLKETKNTKNLITDLNRVGELSDATTDLIRKDAQARGLVPDTSSLDAYEVNSDEMFSLLTGGMTRRTTRRGKTRYSGLPKDEPERIAMLRNSKDAATELAHRLDSIPVTSTKAQKYRNAAEFRDHVAADLAQKRVEALDSFEMDSLLDAIAKDSDVFVKKGIITPADAQAIQNNTTLEHIAQHWTEASSHEKYLDTVANQMGFPKGTHLDEAGKGYASKFDDLDKALERGEIDLDTYNRSFREAENAQADFEGRLDSTRAAVGDTQSRSISDILGPSWAADPRFGKETTQRLFREASQIAANDASVKSFDYASQNLNRQIHNLQPGTKQQQLLKQKARIDKQAFRARAQVFLNLANQHILAQEGQVALKNTDRVKNIKSALDEVAAKQMEPNQSYVGMEEAPEGFVRPTGDDYLEGLQSDPTGTFSPMPGFYDSHDQLSHMSRSLNRLLMKETGTPETLDNIASRVPESLSKVDQTTGEISPDVDAIMSHFKTDDYGNVTVVNKSDDEATNDFLTDLADHYYNKAESENKRLRDNARRGLRETKIAEFKKTNPEPVSRDGKARPSDERAVGQLRGMFTVKTNADGTEKLTTPVFHSEDGTEFAVGSNKAKDYVRENGLVSRGDFQQAKTAEKLLDDINTEGAQGALRNRVRHFIDKVTESGKSGVPKGSTEEKINWIKANKDALKIDFEPETIASRRLFENEHGMSVREANELKTNLDDSQKIGLDDTEYANSAWGRNHIGGVSKADIRDAANGTPDEFYNMFAEAGAPFSFKASGMSAKEARRTGRNMKQWATQAQKIFKAAEPGKRNKMLDTMYRNAESNIGKAGDKQARAIWEKNKDRYLASDEGKVMLPGDQIKKFRQQALTKAEADIRAGLAQGNLETGPLPGSKVLPRQAVGYNTPTENMKQVITRHFDSKKSAMLIQQHLAKVEKNVDEVKRIEQEIARNEQSKKTLMAAADKQMKEAKEARQVMKRRLLEDAILTTAKISAQSPNKRIGLRLFGQMVAIPGSQMMFKTAERAFGLPLMDRISDVSRAAFKAPSSNLNENAALIAARYNAVTPNIVERRVIDLQNGLGQFSEKLRKDNFNVFYRTGKFDNPEFEAAMQRAFSDFVSDGTAPGLFSNKHQVGDTVLTLSDINRHMPEGWGLALGKNAPATETVHDIYRNLVMGSQGRLNTKATREGWNGKRLKTEKSKLRAQLADPYHVAWNLQVAAETAYAEKALHYQIRSLFGVKREAGSATEMLHEKAGWQTVDALGNTEYFPPEAMGDIKRLLDMTKPEHVSAVGRKIDEVMRVWKTATTVYNPGFWTRNGIGEIMSSWIAGVHSAEPYRHAASVVRYARKDGAELDALKSQFPMMSHVPSDSVNGQRTLFTMQNGRKVSVEDIWVAYFDQGLKTGFFNTEFNRELSKTGAKIRGNEVGQYAANAHQGMRLASEGYEDWLRMSHFIDTIQKSPAKDLKTAAEQAAKDVRKYHFDYADFTQFEKATMMRVFPFYKWTRKAMPLFAEMLFLKPGKISAYPKVMAATESSTISTDDIGGDKATFAPNYTGIVPDFIQDMWAYKIRSYGNESEQNAKETYLNVNVPQMDALKSINNPLGTARGLLNPALKIPLDRATGSAQEYGASPLDQLLNSLPQTNFANKVADKKGETPEEDIWRFITGLGLYQNNESQKTAQGFRDR